MSDIILSNTLDHLINEIEKVISDAKENVAYTVNRTITQTYWMIGPPKSKQYEKVLLTLSKLSDGV